MKNIIISIIGLYNGGAERSLVNFLSEINFNEYNVDLLLFKNEGMFLSQVPVEVNILEIPDTLKCSYSSFSSLAFKNLVCFKASINRVIGTFLSKTYSVFGKKYRYDQSRWKYFYSHTIKNVEKHYDVAIAYMHGEPLYFTAEKISADKKIGWIHNDYNAIGYNPNIDIKYLKKYNHIVSISDECVKILKDTFPEIEDRFINIPNLTSSTFVKSMAQKEIPHEMDKKIFKLLSIGRLTYQKGFDIAIEAATILKQKGYKFIWYIIGEGKLKEDLQKQVISNSVEDCFVFLGAKENPYSYIVNCDLFVQTSRFEGKSMVLDEAKILEKPIVVTNYPTVFDQIKNDEEGLIVEMNAEAIANGIKKFILHPEYILKFKDFLSFHEYGNNIFVSEYYKLMD